MAVIKLNGTALASSQWNDFGTIAAINDGNNATGWSGGGVGVTTDWAAIQFAGAEKAKQVDAYFYSWGNTIVIGYSNTAPTSKASFTVVRTIDVRVDQNDDLGVPWARLTKNTIILPGDSAGVYWGIYTNDVGPGRLGFNGGGLDRARIMELNFYKDDVIVPALPAGPNPKPPVTTPTSPFATTPGGWTRTEIAANGTGTFTPGIDTTLIVVGLQGAGAGGRPNVSVTGQTTLNDSTLNGGDTFISNANGVIANAPGAIGNVLPFPAKFAGNLGTPCDWLRAIDNSARAGGTTAVGSNTGTGGGQSLTSGVAGAALTLAVQYTNGPVTATTTFTGAAALPFTPTYVNASRVSGTGLTTSNGLAPSAGNPTTGSIEFAFKAYAGQQFTVNTIAIAPAGACTLTYYLNGVAKGTIVQSVGNAVPVVFTAEVDGTQTVKFELIITATTGTVPFLRISTMTVVGVGQAGAQSGASGRASTFMFLPETFTYTVGKGGVGQPGGQAVNATHNGTRGSGGGVGGNGGDGVIVIYEYKSPLPLEKAPQPLFPNYNVALASEVLAAYRTNYFGSSSNAAGLGWKTATSFTHKLRPRTKNVIALLTGPGGQWRSPTPILSPDQSLHTVLTSGTLVNTAESGWTGQTFGGSTANGGVGGIMQDGDNVLFAGRGTTGQGTGGSDQNPSVIAGGYGTGAQSSYLSLGGGGCGGYGLVIIPASQFPADRTLQLQVGNTNTSAGAGAIFLYETESDNTPFITQLAEEILFQSGIAATVTTQTAEQVLLKQTSAGSNISQTSENILYKESDSTNNMQVSHAHMAFVVDADDPATTVTQNSENILYRQGPASTFVSVAAENVFMRTGTLPFRISSTVEMVFAAELPSVFWLNFGTIQYPLIRKSYDSQIGRATSVQPGAYIQLESPHMDGTTLVVNGVEVGLSSPVSNNDQILVRGGVTNFFQTEMNVYTYYTKNGQIARELVGQWKFTREPLTPTISRKYSVPYTNTQWIKTGANYGFGNNIPLWTRALSAIGATLSALFSKAMTSIFSGNGAVVSQNNHDTFAGPTAEFTQADAAYAEGAKSMITKAQEVLGEQIGGAGAAAPHVNLQAWDGYTQMIPGAEPVTMLEFERVQQHIDHYENTDFVGDMHAGFGVWTAIDYLTGNPVGFGKVAKEYEYNAVGKSYSSEQEYTAIYNSGTGKPFSMGFIGTIAYSVLAGVSYTKNSGIGTGNWLMPEGQADIARAGFGFVTMNSAERAIAHPHLADRGVERNGEMNQGYFETSPIMHIVGFGSFEQSVVKSSVNSGTFVQGVIHTRQYSALANLTAYRPAEAISGRDKASLYMGFDTLQDVQDFTEQYSGVTTLAAYNGYVYNLAVDKSFVCEIYFNGPISGLIQGG
jgi:hypothetical protein